MSIASEAYIKDAKSIKEKNEKMSGTNSYLMMDIIKTIPVY